MFRLDGLEWPVRPVWWVDRTLATFTGTRDSLSTHTATVRTPTLRSRLRRHRPVLCWSQRCSPSRCRAADSDPTPGGSRCDGAGVKPLPAWAHWPPEA